jgi:hypothetical protein
MWPRTPNSPIRGVRASAILLYKSIGDRCFGRVMRLGSLSKQVMTYGGCGAGMRWEGSAIKCTAASGLATAADETTAAYMATDPGADGGSCWCCSDSGTVRGEAGVVVVVVVVVVGVIWLLRRQRTPSRCGE